MLVLSRFKNEVFCIGNDIKIMVVDVRRDGRVRIGIDAPRDVSVHREEVYASIEAEYEKLEKQKK